MLQLHQHWIIIKDYGPNFISLIVYRNLALFSKFLSCGEKKTYKSNKFPLKRLH